jgi:pilus assembly protein CpaB
VKSVFYAALAVSVLATVGAYRALQATRVSDVKRNVTSIVVARRDVPEGAEVDRDAVQIAQWPSNVVPSGAATSLDSVVGRISRTAIFTGDPVTSNRLAPRGSSGGLEMKIAPGKRAMAVPINDVSGLGTLIQPNSRVDVLVTLRPDAGEYRQVGKVFLSNIRVLSVGGRLQPSPDAKDDKARSAALEVTPEQAERLAVAETQGTIQLVLRGFDDPDSAHTPGASTADVMAQLRNAPSVDLSAQQNRANERRARRPAPAPAPTAAVAAPTPVVEAPPKPRADSAVIRVYRGSKVEQQVVGRDSIRRRPP